MSRLPLTLAGRMASVTEARSVVKLALDRSVRSYDSDGRMRVATSVLTRACVSAYLGSEVPNGDELGLDPRRTYNILRPIEELKRALPLFNSMPLLSEHTPVSAEDHRPDMVIGATGSDARIVGDAVVSSLVVWAQQGIDQIETGAAKALSCGYKYRAVAHSGNFGGVPYSLVMTDIEPNHLTICPEGRVMGAMVGDAAPKVTKDNDVDIEKLMSFLGGKLSSEDLVTVGKMLAGNDDSDMVGDDPPPFKGRLETGGTMTGDARRQAAAAADFDQRYPNRSRSQGTL
jgi:hypothetical protein